MAIKAFPNQTRVPQGGGTPLASFPADLPLPTLTAANAPGYNYGQPFYIIIGASTDPAPLIPGTNQAWVVDIAAMNVGGVLLPSSGPNAGNGYGYVALYNTSTQTYGPHIPCIISAASNNEPGGNQGIVDILVTPVGGKWPLGKVVVILEIGLPAVAIQI